MTAFVFDLDGTLIDSRLDIAAACNHALVWAGREPLPPSEIGKMVGDGARKLLMRAFAQQDIDAPLAEFLRYYSEHPLEHARWMPGAREVLDELSPAAVVTNKARVVAERVLDALGIRGKVALVAGGDGPLKPDPTPILRAMRELSSTPAETWVIGDGDQDVGAGNAAGCKTVAVLGGFHSEQRLRAAKPSFVINSLTELPALVRR